MARLTFNLMQQLAQTGTLLYFKKEDFSLNEYGTFITTDVEVKQEKEIPSDFLKNLFDINWIRMSKQLGGTERWSYRFANNGFVEVFGVSVSPDRKLKSERTLTIKWGG